MAQTFGDFIQEGMVYEYSQEYYDLIKECSELRLMERYLENQQFLAESADTSVFSEGYLMEAASPDTTESVKTTVGQKIGKLAGNLKAKFKKLINTVRSFIRSFINKSDPLTKQAIEVHKKLRTIKLTNDDIETIYGMITTSGNSDNKSNDKLNVGSLHQPFRSSLKLSYDLGFDPKSNPHTDIVENFLAATLTTSEAMVTSLSNMTAGDEEDRIGAVPAEDLIKYLKPIVDNRFNSDINNALAGLKKSYHNTKRSGFPINVNSGKLEKLIKTLDEIYAYVDEKGESAKEDAESAKKSLESNKNIKNDISKEFNRVSVGDSDDKKERLKDLQDRYKNTQDAINKDKEWTNNSQERANAYAKLFTASSSTLQVYSDYLKLRKTIIDRVSTFVNKKASD